MRLIDRAFRRLAAGQVHYRFAGTGHDGATPLLMLHGGPGSSASLAPLIDLLSQDRSIVAPDLMGNGDSDPLPPGPVTIEAHAAYLIEMLDALGLDHVDIYGHHSGAQVACEIAIARPDRVRRMVLNGVALFTPDERAEFALRYAPPVVPVEDGTHLAQLWDFAAHLTRYFPHYRRDDAHRIDPAMTLSPDALMRIVADMLKAWPTYHRLYQAAFVHDVAERLPMVAAATLILRVAGDPLARYAAQVAAMMPECRIESISRSQVGDAIIAFLATKNSKTPGNSL